MSENVVLSLFDRTGNMVKPWAEDGYECICVDIQHNGRTVDDSYDGKIVYVEADIEDYLPPREDYEIVFAFPPCDNLAVSGARWFKKKGLEALYESIGNVIHAKRICEWSDSTWMIENPVSTLSTYWREPDYTFHPYEYSGYSNTDDAYQKRTCLWTGNGLSMPQTDAVEEYDERIHQKTSDPDERAKTPMGFARAVYESNS